jgi:aspartyl-tRNA(Asn)/glutamyl-tRNA(Gln) amidotransferase subunit C
LCDIIILYIIGRKNVYDEVQIMDVNIKRIAELASLEINEADEKLLTKQFEEIVDMVSELPEEVDGGNTSQPMNLREDTIEECDIDHDALLSNAYETVSGCFAVPRTVEY